MMDTNRIFTAGGTIDKIYFDANSAYEVGLPNISKVLHNLPITIEYRITALLQKDSLEMTHEGRELIFESIRSAEENHIVITHGTDTMVETATFLSGIKDKTIVLTGAPEPVKCS